MLKWSRRVLHEKCGVPERTIQRMAEAEGVPNTNAQNVEIVQKCLEAEGVQFISANGGGVGVRLKDSN